MGKTFPTCGECFCEKHPNERLCVCRLARESKIRLKQESMNSKYEFSKRHQTQIKFIVFCLGKFRCCYAVSIPVPYIHQSVHCPDQSKYFNILWYTFSHFSDPWAANENFFAEPTLYRLNNKNKIYRDKSVKMHLHNRIFTEQYIF